MQRVDFQRKKSIFASAAKVGTEIALYMGRRKNPARGNKQFYLMVRLAPSFQKGESMSVEKTKIRFKDILNRNLVLIIFIQILSDCVNNMVGGYTNMAAKSAGIAVAAIGMAASAYSIAGMLVRMPAGTLADSQKKKLALIGVLFLRMFTCLFLSSFGMLGNVNFVVAKAVHGIGWSCVGIVLPAVVAMMMDKKAMGTTYAILSLVTGFFKTYAKAFAVTIFNKYGAMGAAMACCVLTISAVALVMLLDFNDPRVLAATPKKRGGKLASLKVKYVPICAILSLVVFGWQMHTQFDNVLAQERGIDIAAILSIAAFITPFTGFASAALCDIMDPKLVLCVLYLFLGAGNLIVGHATGFHMFALGEILTLIGIQYSRVISIYLFKNCATTEKGAVHATNYMTTDLLSIVSGVVLGALISALGYELSYTITGVSVLAATAVVFLFGTRMIRNAASTAEQGSENAE